MNLVTTETTTMTSREIAEITGKRHDNVIRDIEKYSESPKVRFPVESITYKVDGQIREYRAYVLGKRESLILVSGYSIELRTAIIDRWEELEKQNTISIGNIGIEMLLGDKQLLIEYAMARINSTPKRVNIKYVGDTSQVNDIVVKPFVLNSSGGIVTKIPGWISFARHTGFNKIILITNKDNPMLDKVKEIVEVMIDVMPDMRICLISDDLTDSLNASRAVVSGKTSERESNQIALTIK